MTRTAYPTPYVNTLHYAAKCLNLLVGPILYRPSFEAIEIKGLLALCRYKIGPTSPMNKKCYEISVYVTWGFGAFAPG
ncbi:MAG: hypothetical protein QG656_1251 [Candidatus Hydrogenedentes bacterium]|nr:hypothetical protein [Candidatus Hydrogenedentota bacterium]